MTAVSEHSQAPRLWVHRLCLHGWLSHLSSLPPAWVAVLIHSTAVGEPGAPVLLPQPGCSCPSISAPASAWTPPSDQLWEEELSGLKDRPHNHLTTLFLLERGPCSCCPTPSAVADRRRKNRAPRFGMEHAQSQLRLAAWKRHCFESTAQMRRAWACPPLSYSHSLCSKRWETAYNSATQPEGRGRIQLDWQM